MVIIFSIQGFRSCDSSIDPVLIFEFGNDIMILKMAFFDKADIMEIEAALIKS